MLTMERAPSVALVMTDAIGRRIRERRTRLGMPVNALAKRAGVDRGRLAAIEEGGANPRASTVGAIERALDELEAEMGIDADLPPGARRIGPPEEGLVEFIVEGNFGVRAVVKGPIGNIEELQRAAAELIAGMGEPPARGIT